MHSNLCKSTLCISTPLEHDQNKIRQATGQRRVRSSTSGLLITLITEIKESKREPAPGAFWQNREPLPNPHGVFWAPSPPQAEHSSIFDDPGTLQKSTHFWDPSKSTMEGGKVAPWPP